MPSSMLGDFHLSKWRCIGLQEKAMHLLFYNATSKSPITFFPYLKKFRKYPPSSKSAAVAIAAKESLCVKLTKIWPDRRGKLITYARFGGEQPDVVTGIWDHDSLTALIKDSCGHDGDGHLASFRAGLGNRSLPSSREKWVFPFQGLALTRMRRKRLPITPCYAGLFAGATPRIKNA